MASAAELIRMVCAAFLDALYPNGCVCPLCDAEKTVGDDGLCSDCRKQVLRCVRPVCPEPLDGLSAAFVYAEPVRGAIHRFKYQRETYLARFFAHEIPIPESWTFDCYVPVPLHKHKLRSRGYNQSERLAKYLAKKQPASVRTDLLIRVRNTLSQATLNSGERKSNVRGAFKAPINCEGLSVVLVDDVTTTGETLLECAHVLKKAGAVRVYALCAACAHP